MNKALLLITTISIAGILVFVSSQSNSNNSQSSVNQNAVQEKLLLDDEISSLPSHSEKTHSPDPETSSTAMLRNGNAETILEEKNNYSNSFLNSGALKSTHSLNNAFVISGNQISSKAIEAVFSDNDFARLIEVAQELEKDSDSWGREDALREQVTTLLGDRFQSEIYSCNGKICMIKLDYKSSDVNEDILHKISDFGSNYTFSKLSKNESDGMTYKGVFIKTDDPSNMILSLNN